MTERINGLLRRISLVVFLALVATTLCCAEKPADAASVESQFQTAMEQGAVYARQGNNASALARFKRAYQLKPMNAEALYRMALVFCDDRMYGAAESVARKATLLDQHHAGAWLVLGTALFYLDHEDEAIAHLEKAFSLDATNPHAPYMLGRCYYFGGHDRDRAVQYFKRTLELDPKYIAATFMLGCCYLDADMAGAAAKHFEAVLKVEPNNLEARFRLALCAIREKKFDDAEKTLADLLRQNENDYRAHLKLADIYLNYRGDRAYALIHYDRFMALAPEEVAERRRVAGVLETLRPTAKGDAATSGTEKPRPASATPSAGGTDSSAR